MRRHRIQSVRRGEPARREIVAAIGYIKPEKKKATPQGGILKLDEQRREILLVTLDKSATSFSPTTRYRDYAISPREVAEL